MVKNGLFGENPWVWLDEWDLEDKSGKKKLYTKEIFDKLQ